LIGRILALVDAYDSMTSHRPYRASLSDEESLRRLRAKAGTQFDPQLVAAFLALHKDGVIEGIRTADNEAVFTDSRYADAA
jgi:HD-GYP domain-containing protein (c-di-GMP phosphodiesterase class II)